MKENRWNSGKPNIIEEIVKAYCQKRCGHHFYRCPQLCDTVKLIDKIKNGEN